MYLPTFPFTGSTREYSGVSDEYNLELNGSSVRLATWAAVLVSIDAMFAFQAMLLKEKPISQTFVTEVSSREKIGDLPMERRPRQYT